MLEDSQTEGALRDKRCGTHSKASLSAGSRPSKINETTMRFHESAPEATPPSPLDFSAIDLNSDQRARTMSATLVIT